MAGLAYPDDGEIEQELTLVAVRPQWRHGRVCRALLVYGRDDPYAMNLLFSRSVGGAIWTFARELLLEGVVRGGGVGDVRFLPDGRRRLRVMLMNTREWVQLVTPVLPVWEFLDKSYEMVPHGDEAEWLDVEGCCARLLAS